MAAMKRTGRRDEDTMRLFYLPARRRRECGKPLESAAPMSAATHDLIQTIERTRALPHPIDAHPIDTGGAPIPGAR
jgi:hypothetical protein